MCFAPWVSLSTFIIEFLFAIYFLSRSPKDKLNQIIALISLLLGTYQLNEFLICVTQVSLFTRFALITIAILPSLGISYVLIMSRKKIKYYWHLLIYSPAIFFIILFAISNHLNQSAICSTVFIEFPWGGLYGAFFGAYYLIYLSAATILFYYLTRKIKSKYEIGLNHLGMFGMLLFTLPTFVFLSFLPSLKIQFPSVLCEFALLLAIELIIVIWYKEKHNLKY